MTTLYKRYYCFPISGFRGTLPAAKMSRKGLMEQDLSKLDVTKLHPLSPEVISRQATINIGKTYVSVCIFYLMSNN